MPGQKKAQNRFQIDWLISNLRWLLLLSVALVLCLDFFATYNETIEVSALLAPILILLFAMLYNIGVVFLLSQRSNSIFVPVSTLVVDTFLSIGFVLASGGLESPLLFFALFPILTAAFRFSQPVSLAVALAVIAIFGGAVYLVSPPGGWLDLVPFGIFSVVLLFATLVSSFVSDEVKKIVSRKREEELEIERRKLHAAREHSRLTFELASTLSATLNYNKVLNAVLEVGEKGMQELGHQAAKQIGAVLLFSHDDLHVAVSRHLPPRDRKVLFEGKDGVIGEALAEAESVVSNEPASDPELSRLVGIHSCKQVIVVPLRAGFESFGVVIFGSSEPNTYTPDLQNLLIAICNQAIVALQNAQLYQNLREEKERIVAVEEDARKKLARNLHDGPTQSIASIAMRVNFVQRLLKNDVTSDQISEELERVEDLARHTTKQIRHMLFTLRPLILETQGLEAALEQYIDKLSDTEEIAIHLETDLETEDLLEQERQGTVFYIIEEAVSNARKHSQAQNIWVRLRLQDPRTFIAEVEDDGEGFDVDAVQMTYDRRGSLGLINMHERAEMVNGKLTISSVPNGGTRVKLSVPLNGAA